MPPSISFEHPSTHKANLVHAEHVLGLSKKTVSQALSGSLPAEFYHSPKIYDLERRAIFSKRWFLVSHKARYRNVGDYVLYEMAGFTFVVVKNKEEKIVGFHNICRFTSESVPSFDPSAIRLFPIHTHVDENGFVYVNLDAGKDPGISWQDQYGRIDRQDRLTSSNIDWNLVEYDFTWTEDGNYNWKLMQDNFNECYHCLTAHPDVAKTTALDTYYVEPGASGSYIAHFSEPKPSMTSAFDETRFQGRSATHVFPVGHFSPNPGTGFMHLMRTIPTGPTTVRQEYDVYKLNTPHASAEAHERMIKFYQKVTSEDVGLCNAVQTNLQRGIYTAGPLHPFHEEGVASFQRMVKDSLINHLDEEERVGREIWPAKPDDGMAALGFDDTCARVLNCGRSDLEW